MATTKAPPRFDPTAYAAKRKEQLARAKDLREARNKPGTPVFDTSTASSGRRKSTGDAFGGEASQETSSTDSAPRRLSTPASASSRPTALQPSNIPGHQRLKSESAVPGEEEEVSSTNGVQPRSSAELKKGSKIPSPKKGWRPNTPKDKLSAIPSGPDPQSRSELIEVHTAEPAVERTLQVTVEEAASSPEPSPVLARRPSLLSRSLKKLFKRNSTSPGKSSPSDSPSSSSPHSSEPPYSEQHSHATALDITDSATTPEPNGCISSPRSASKLKPGLPSPRGTLSSSVTAEKVGLSSPRGTPSGSVTAEKVEKAEKPGLRTSPPTKAAAKAGDKLQGAQTGSSKLPQQRQRSDDGLPSMNGNKKAEPLTSSKLTPKQKAQTSPHTPAKSVATAKEVTKRKLDLGVSQPSSARGEEFGTPSQAPGLSMDKPKSGPLPGPRFSGENGRGEDSRLWKRSATSLEGKEAAARVGTGGEVAPAKSRSITAGIGRLLSPRGKKSSAGDASPVKASKEEAAEAPSPVDPAPILAAAPLPPARMPNASPEQKQEGSAAKPAKRGLFESLGLAKGNKQEQKQRKSMSAAGPASSGPVFPGEAPEDDESVELTECPDCGRKFRPEVLAKHSAICKKVFLTKRKAFDSTAHRVAGTEAAEFVEKPPGNWRSAQAGSRGSSTGSTSNTASGSGKPAAAATAGAGAGGAARGGGGGGGGGGKSAEGDKKPAWKARSEAFQAAIRAAREMKEAEAAGISLASLPPPPPMENPDYIQCPNCSRRFAPTTAERHIPKCKDIKAKPTSLVRKKPAPAPKPTQRQASRPSQ